MCTAICLDPQKQSVTERFSLLGECVIRARFLCIVLHNMLFTVQSSVLMYA